MAWEATRLAASEHRFLRLWISRVEAEDIYEMYAVAKSITPMYLFSHGTGSLLRESAKAGFI